MTKKYMYGKLFDETSRFRDEISSIFSDFVNKHKELSMEIISEVLTLRNRMYSLLNSWVGSKRLENKFGIKIPLDSTPLSFDVYLEKQGASSSKKYKPCEICGEDRIINYAHILPRGGGGVSNEKNYLYLCPTHHHLFDFERLTKEEWNKLDFSNKLEAAQEYIKEYKMPLLEKFWKNNV